MARFSALLDACVLAPIALADTLLRLAEADLFGPCGATRFSTSAFVLSSAADPARDWFIGMSTKLRAEATLGHDGVGVGGIARV